MPNHTSNSLSSNDPQQLSSEDVIDTRSSIIFESPKQGGRHRDFIWSCFDDMGPAKTAGHRKAQCKYCVRFFNFAKLSLMYSHIAHQCDEVVNHNPNFRKEVLAKLRDPDEDSSPARKRKRTTEVGSPNLPIHTQHTMDRFTSRMISNNEQQSIDRCLLRAVVMNGMLFRTADNHFFVEFIEKLNPSYVLPDRKKLACEILTEEMVCVESKNESLLAEAAPLTLNIDGWNERCGRSLYEYNVITDSRRAIVLSLLDISSHHHTAEILVQKLESVLARSTTTINITSKVRAIVTDNPVVMQKMRELFISKSGNQHIIGLRCFAHAINLIAGK